MYSSMMTPVCTDTPKSARNPMPEDTLKCVPRQVERQQSADARQRHVARISSAHLAERNIV